MSLVFEALQSLEAERYGAQRPTPPEALELLKCVERRVVSSPNALPMGPDVDAQVGEPAKLFTVPSPVITEATAAEVSVSEVAVVEAAVTEAAAVELTALPVVTESIAAAPAEAVAAHAAVAEPAPASPFMAASAAVTSAARVAVTAAVAQPMIAAAPMTAPPMSAPPAWMTPSKPAEKTPAAAAPRKAPTKVERALAMFSAALPVVQNVLNLVDPGKGAALASLLAPKPQAKPAALAAPAVDLSAITESLTAFRNQQRDLHAQVVEQNSSLKRIESQLELVREATHRNTLEQKEMIEDLRGVGSKINVVAAIGLGLLAASVAGELVVYLRMLKIF